MRTIIYWRREDRQYESAGFDDINFMIHISVDGDNQADQCVGSAPFDGVPVTVLLKRHAIGSGLPMVTW